MRRGEEIIMTDKRRMVWEKRDSKDERRADRSIELRRDRRMREERMDWENIDSRNERRRKGSSEWREDCFSKRPKYSSYDLILRSAVNNCKINTTQRTGDAGFKRTFCRSSVSSLALFLPSLFFMRVLV